MTQSELTALNIQQQINDLNEILSIIADIHSINEKIRDLLAQQTQLQTEKLKSDMP